MFLRCFKAQRSLEESLLRDSEALEAIRQAEGLKTQWKAKVEQLEAANQELKERAAVEVRRLKQEAGDEDMALGHGLRMPLG